MAVTTLFNRGKSQITFAKGKTFMPGSAGTFSVEDAARLRRLYPDTVQSMEDMTAKFSVTAENAENFQADDAPKATDEPPVLEAPKIVEKSKAKADDAPKAAV